MITGKPYPGRGAAPRALSVSGERTARRSRYLTVGCSPLTGAFINRFAIGFDICAARLPVPAWAQRLIFGVLLSLPDTIITKAYVPILILGAVGRIIIGIIVGKWGA